MWRGKNIIIRKGNKMKKSTRISINDRMPNKWISINDRMPNRGETVLTVRKRRTTGKYYIAMDILSVDNQWIYQMQDITLYWRPLPDLPKELEQ